MDHFQPAPSTTASSYRRREGRLITATVLRRAFSANELAVLLTS